MFTYHCTYHFTSLPTVEQAVTQLLDMVEKHTTAEETAVKLVFFGSARNNSHYTQQLALIDRLTQKRWNHTSPLHSLVIQPVQGGATMAVECHYIDTKNIVNIEYLRQQEARYAVIQTNHYRLIMTAGILAPHLSHPIAHQSAHIFQTVEAILKREKCPIQQIVRQWNYIEQITHIEQGVQHYQSFNDARTLFYQKTSWQPHGYPAATGIGTQWGGVMVELIAAIPTNNSTIVPIDNPMQTPAHNYSQQVLLGKTHQELPQPSTPKFERAKVVGTVQGEGICFISGTAAIRGEESLIETDIARQVSITLENVAQLTSNSNLERAGFKTTHTNQPSNLRIYLKQPEHYPDAHQTVNQQIECKEQLYVVADICRSELLVEIEGVTTYVASTKNTNK